MLGRIRPWGSGPYKHMKIIFCITVVLAGLVSGFAQEKAIDKSEFDRIVNNSTYPYARWKGKSYRSTVTTEARLQGPSKTAEGPPFTMHHTTKMVSEFGPGNAYRQMREASYKEGEVKKYEYIRIGDFEYSRIGNESWTKKAVENAPAPPTVAPAAPPSPFEEISSDKEYKYLGTEPFRNATVLTYLATSKQKNVYKANGSEHETVITTKYWIDKDGTLLRSEFRAAGKGVDRSNTTTVIMDFALDPSISITAPTVP